MLLVRPLPRRVSQTGAVSLPSVHFLQRGLTYAHMHEQSDLEHDVPLRLSGRRKILRRERHMTSREQGRG